MAEAERVLRELARAGMTRERPPRRARRRRRRRPRRLLRPPLPARRPGRAGADHAGRPGRLRLRRQDRRRPARGQELRRRLPPAGRGRSPTPATLATLPPEELAAGFVEALKTGLLAGGALWERVRPIEALDPAELDDVVFACARYKCEVVAADERDTGLRQVLNLGHTVGHAIEAATGYERYRHGEAIGLGLLAALRLSEAPELRDEVEAILARHGLPTRTRRRRRGVEAILDALQRDKKRTAAGVGFVLLAEPGEPRIGQLVDPDRVRAAVEELLRMTATRNRVAVLHGVNFDILERRDPSVYGGRSLSELEHADRGLGARAGPGTDLLPDQPRGRVRRVPAPAARPGRRGAGQRRRLDPLQPRDRRRARRRRPARGRGPPLRRRGARGLAQGLGLRRPGAGEDLRQGRRRLPRGAGAAGRRARGERLMRGRGDRLEAVLAERELDRMLVTDLTNVRYLTGFTGTNGACVCGPGVRLFLTDFRYTERAAAEVEGWEAVTVDGDWLGGIAERLEGRVGFEDDQHVGPHARASCEEKLGRRGRGGAGRRHGRGAAAGQGRGGAGGDRRGLEARRRGLDAGASSAASPAAASARSPAPPKRGSASSAATPPSRRSSPPAPTAPCRTPSPASG